MHFSLSEIIVILLVSLVVIKPAQLPEVAKSLAQALKKFRDASQKIKQEIHESLGEDKNS